MNYEKQKCLESVWIGPWRERSPVAVTAPYLCILPASPRFLFLYLHPYHGKCFFIIYGLANSFFNKSLKPLL